MWVCYERQDVPGSGTSCRFIIVLQLFNDGGSYGKWYEQ